MTFSTDTLTRPRIQREVPVRYKKPPTICKPAEELFPEATQGQEAFLDHRFAHTEDLFAQQGLSVRLVDFNDIPAVEHFILNRYPDQIADEISPYDLFRFIEFGHGLVLETEENRIVGCVFEVPYAAKKSVSYTTRIGGHVDWCGRKLGEYITWYSMLLTLEDGSDFKRTIIDYDNFESLAVFTNKLGWVCDGFDKDLAGLGSCFKVSLSVCVPCYTSNVIDPAKVVEYVATHEQGNDYEIVKGLDVDALQNLYDHTDFKVVGVMKPGTLADYTTYFALHERHLTVS